MVILPSVASGTVRRVAPSGRHAVPAIAINHSADRIVVFSYHNQCIDWIHTISIGYQKRLLATLAVTNQWSRDGIKRAITVTGLSSGRWLQYMEPATPVLLDNSKVGINDKPVLTRSGTEKKQHEMYRQVSNIRRTLVCNKIVDHSDVVGASPVGAAPTTSSFST